MVDPIRLARLLQRLGDQLALLHERAAIDRATTRADEILLSATKYRFVTAIEAVIDIAHHLLASELWGPAATSGDAVRTLSRHDVIESDLAERLARAIGFRNLLVHGYADVDDDLVVEQLDRLGDLDSFIEAVRSWAAAQ